MDLRLLNRRVLELMAEGDFAGVERLLSETRRKAEAGNDAQVLEYVLSELVSLCLISEPLRCAEAEALSIEREKLNPSAHNKLQTAIILHQAGDYARAIPKLEEAIARSKIEDDERTVYTSLSLLGQRCLELGQTGRALTMLGELEQMVANKGHFVVGDETCFLEALQARRIATGRVAKLASTLASACRDAEFTERLHKLASKR